MKIKQTVTALILAFILCLSSCSSTDSFSDVSSSVDSLTSSLGGQVIIYRSDTYPMPDALVSLYGRAGDPPDELSLIDFAAVWYSDRLISADAAVFHAINATDIPSIIKMCKRRAETLKLAAGVDMVIGSGGHYVYVYTDGIPELAQMMSELFNISDMQ